LIGRTFLKETEEDGQWFRAHVVRGVIDKGDELKQGSAYLKFICEVPNSTVDEIFTYNEILDHIEKDNNDMESDTEQLFKFCRIAAHQGHLHSSDKDWKGSSYNVLVEWETGETTYERLNTIAADDPVTCTECAKENNLLDTDGWKQFRRLVKNEKKLKHMINQAKLNYRREPFWKLGVLVPRNHAQAMELYKQNGNTKWQDAEGIEMGQLLEYNTWIDKGIGGIPPNRYKKIRCHMIYDVKHDG
jgi:hypothetical protein